MLKLPSLQKSMIINSEIQLVNAQSTEFQKAFVPTKEVEELIESYQANNSELYDIEVQNY